LELLVFGIACSWNDRVKIAASLRAFSDETLTALDVGLVKLPCLWIDRAMGGRCDRRMLTPEFLRRYETFIAS
jgi:hypothetical protein